MSGLIKLAVLVLDMWDLLFKHAKCLVIGPLHTLLVQAF